MSDRPIKVAWISEYPIEWMPDLPGELQHLPKDHPATWMPVLLSELEKDPSVCLHVIVLRKGLPADVSFTRNGVHFHALRVPKGMRATTLFWVDTWKIRKQLKEIQPDLVHAWGTERGAALVASRLSYPFLVTMQGLMTWYRDLIPVCRYDRYAAFLEEITLRRTRVITTESSFAVGYLQKRYPHLRIHQAEHASNWFFHNIDRHPQTDPVRFLCVGTVTFRKGSDLVLQALNQLTPEFPFELIIVGSGGELFEEWKPKLSEAFLKRIQIKTQLKPEQVAQEMSKATIKLMPTRADTSPNAVKEAAVAGLPVIGSVIGGIPDYIFPDKNGLLFPSEDLPRFVQCIRDAVKHPLFGQGKVDPATLTQVREYLSPTRMRQRFLEAYQLVLQDARSRSGS